MRKVQHIEAVTVCIGYADFLRETLKYNIPLLDRIIVITSPDDRETREVCKRNGLVCVVSEDHKAGGHEAYSDFNKGALVEKALHQCSENAWRLHLDADIVLPHQFRHLLETAGLREDCLYGVDRINIRGWEEWQRLQKSGWLQGGEFQHNWQIHFPGDPIGDRVAPNRMGYVPIGFFQLWHSIADEFGGIHCRPYPSTHGTAARSDVKFALQWDRSKRVLVPEIVVAHLESEKGRMGVNWNGRKSAPFGPPQVLINTEAPGPSGNCDGRSQP
jgi:hypothetical protein